MPKVTRAIVSVFDKTGVLPLCETLVKYGVQILSTGGTAKLLGENNIPYTNVAEFTGSPEMMDGRVKTLHPKIHGGILGLRDNEKHQVHMKENGIEPIDLVVINLYPFEVVSSKEDTPFADVIEMIDIGGPSMIRSAAKNYRFVGVATSPNQYDRIIEELNSNDGQLTDSFRQQLALEAFQRTSEYDSSIANFLFEGKPGIQEFKGKLDIRGEKLSELRYGENPHQKAAFYQLGEKNNNHLTNAKQYQGKELSFNNILDFDGALNCVLDFEDPACVIIKHSNPCGVAIANDVTEAFEKAWNADNVSAFGSVIAINREVDEQTASAISKYFVEGLIAPSFSKSALEVLSKKKNMRVLELDMNRDIVNDDINAYDIKKVSGGLLIQSRDLSIESENDLKVVTKRRPSDVELKDLLFGWKVVKHVKSNAIVYIKNKVTLGIGAGQMSRVDSANFGGQKAPTLEDSMLASDAFFPFRDSIDVAASKGVKGIIQPGGSIRDQEVIDACDEHGIAMVFTGFRHFRH